MRNKAQLFHIAFEATPRCNYSCLYCYNHWRREGEAEPAQATRREAMRTLRKLCAQADFAGISFTGGEPSLTEALPELVLSARLRGKSVNIISNGSGKLEAYRSLASLGIAYFEFPLHSADPAIHEGLTCVPGSHASSLGAIESLAASGSAVIAVIVLTSRNCAGIGATLALAKEKGAKAAMLARFNPGGRGIARMESLLPGLAELKAAFAEANSFSRDKAFSVTANVCIPRCVLDPKDFPKIAISSCGSSPERRPITVDAAGSVRMCNHSPVAMGNIHEHKLADILRSDYAKGWESKPGFCAECVKWTDCFGGCRAASEQLGLGLGREDPIIGKYGIGPLPAST